MKYGFNGLNKNLNRNRNNSFNTSVASQLEGLIIPVRVLGIILDEFHPLFNYYGGWNALGAIQYELVSGGTYSFYSSTPLSDINIPIAYPATPNIKNYPLINEIVYLISLPDNNIGKSNSSTISYYLNITSLWNHPHHNAYPSKANESSPPQQKDYLQTIAGSAVTSINNPTEIFLGKTFKERSNIHPLLPFEGDIIYEGRWGNSIRLGSTVKLTSNNWSNTGTDGDPITIIRNGQGNQNEEGWIPTVEDINNDDSSIYLTSTQKVPLEVSSTSYASYTTNPPTVPSAYAGTQILLSSGRLVFNSKDDHILLSSAKSINFNAVESVNIDTKKFITQADNIYLGKEDLATEPLLLGNTTVGLLKDLIDSLKQLTDTLKTAQTTPAVPGSPSAIPTINLAAVTLSTQLDLLSNQLSTLTSKRNFTV